MSDEIETTEELTEQSLTEEEIESNGGVPVVQQLLLVAGVLLLLFGSTISASIFKEKNNPKSNDMVQEKIELPAKRTGVTESQPFSQVDIVAKSAYVWDVSTQRALYKKNETESVPLASVTKLMTALLANEILNEDSNVGITDDALSQDGDSGLLRYEVFERQTLSDLVLMSSSNDGAFALAVTAGNTLQDGNGASAFVKAMNVRAEELGLKNTVFYNPTGLDLSTSEAGAYGSAKDMSFLMEYIIKTSPNILSFTTSDSARVYSESGQYHDADNTNYYIDEIPGLIGSKTGYTDLAGGNLVIAYDAGLNRPIIITVLGSTQQNRFTDVLELINETNNYLAQE